MHFFYSGNSDSSAVVDTKLHISPLRFHMMELYRWIKEMTPLLPVSMSLVVSKTPALFKICSPHAQGIYCPSPFQSGSLRYILLFLVFFFIHLLYDSFTLISLYLSTPLFICLQLRKGMCATPPNDTFSLPFKGSRESFPKNVPFTFVGGVAVLRLFKYCSLQQ